MPGLTVTEKTHWKTRIERRIDKRIELLWAREPNLQEQMEQAARQRALESLKLNELDREVAQIEAQKESLERRSDKLTRQMLAVVRGIPIEALDRSDTYNMQHEIDVAIERRKKALEDELLANHELGREIVKLRQEKENLLDTIWLATSPSQLKTLWTKVAELLGDETTQLQQDALAIPPVEGE